VGKADWNEEDGAVEQVHEPFSADNDMPPEDAAEFDKYRAEGPASFDSIKDWLAVELMCRNESIRERSWLSRPC
jgi:hypothetical protein